MRHRATMLAALAAVGLTGSAALAYRAESVKEIMAAANKGKDSLFSKVVEGKGSAEDAKKLAELYKEMPGLKPPMGDANGWKAKAGALAEAAQAVADGKPGAAAKLKAAGNCKACHDPHKPKN
jgi:hypothetical protein